eukprot:353921-Chlamydomonas_euryale.AAC.2
MAQRQALEARLGLQARRVEERTAASSDARLLDTHTCQRSQGLWGLPHKCDVACMCLQPSSASLALPTQPCSPAAYGCTPPPKETKLLSPHTHTQAHSCSLAAHGGAHHQTKGLPTRMPPPPLAVELLDRLMAGWWSCAWPAGPRIGDR